MARVRPLVHMLIHGREVVSVVAHNESTHSTETGRFSERILAAKGVMVTKCVPILRTPTSIRQHEFTHRALTR